MRDAKHASAVRLEAELIFPLPVHVSTRIWERPGGMTNEWHIVLVRRAGRYRLLVSDTIGFNDDKGLVVPGGRGVRGYPRSEPGELEWGYVWHGVLQLQHSSSSYRHVPDLVQAHLPYRAYVREWARDAVRATPVLAQLVLRGNVPKQKLRARVNERANMEAACPDEPPSPEEIAAVLADELSENRHSAETEQYATIVQPFVPRLAPPKSANKEILAGLSGGLRKPLLMARDPSALEPLYREFPNFKVALDSVALQLHLFKRTRRPTPMYLSPILMVGAPGLGKTFFAWRLAQALGAGKNTVEIDMATTTAGFVLAGSSPAWSEAQPGKVYEALVHGASANPVFIANEVDKAGTDGVRYPVTAPLLTLLERATAGRFVDEFVAECSLDASWISWLLTANDTKPLTAPLLSRMTVVEIPAPTHDERLVIGQSIYRALLSESPWGPTFPPELGEDVLGALAERDVAPREMRALLLAALGGAARRNAPGIDVDDLGKTGLRQRRIGF